MKSDWPQGPYCLDFDDPGRTIIRAVMGPDLIHLTPESFRWPDFGDETRNARELESLCALLAGSWALYEAAELAYQYIRDQRGHDCECDSEEDGGPCLQCTLQRALCAAKEAPERGNNRFLGYRLLTHDGGGGKEKDRYYPYTLMDLKEVLSVRQRLWKEKRNVAAVYRWEEYEAPEDMEAGYSPLKVFTGGTYHSATDPALCEIVLDDIRAMAEERLVGQRSWRDAVQLAVTDLMADMEGDDRFSLFHLIDRLGGRLTQEEREQPSDNWPAYSIGRWAWEKLYASEPDRGLRVRLIHQASGNLFETIVGSIDRVEDGRLLLTNCEILELRDGDNPGTLLETDEEGRLGRYKSLNLALKYVNSLQQIDETETP